MHLHPRKNIVISDGVWEVLSARELARCLSVPSPKAPRELFEALIAAGCRDNVSFILCGA